MFPLIQNSNNNVESIQKGRKADGLDLLQFLIIISINIFLFLLYKGDSPKDYFMYNIFMDISLLFVHFASIDTRKKYSLVKMLIGIAVMSFLISFRNFTAIDDNVYLKFFLSASNQDYISFIKNSHLEVSFSSIVFLLNKITNGNECFLLPFLSIPPLLTIELTLWKNRDKFDLTVATLFVYMSLYYLIMFAGLIRIFISVSIVFYAYRFIIEKNAKMYFVFIVIASTFHMSALFMLVLLVLLFNKQFFFSHYKAFIILAVILIPLIFIIISKYIVPHLGSRYDEYTIQSIQFSSLFSFIDRLPFLLIAIYFYKQTILLNDSKWYLFGIILIGITISINIASQFVGLGRIVYYTNFGIVITMSMIFRQKRSKEMILYLLGVVSLAYLYINYTIFYNEYAWTYLKDYSTIF